MSEIISHSGLFKISFSVWHVEPGHFWCALTPILPHSTSTSHTVTDTLVALLHWTVPTDSGHHTHSAGEVCREVDLLSPSGPMPQENATVEGKVF